MKSFFFALIFLSFSVFAHAQSAGGGLGGDRPRFLMQEARPTLVANQQMTCAQVIQEVERQGKIRINFDGFKTQTFAVIYPMTSTNCNSSRDRQTVYAQTLDNETCPVGYACK